MAVWQRKFRDMKGMVITMERRDKTNYYLDIAETVLERGTCLRRNFGAIIVKNAALSYSDKASIPKWAIQSYMNLSAYKMLDFYDGLMKPSVALQNDHMADLLWQVWKYTDSIRK